MSWVRLYVEILDDPKTAMLPDHQFRLFCEALCLAKLANLGGDTGMTVEQFDWRLRKKTAKNVEALCRIGILSMSATGTVSVTQWAKRQFESDTSTSRVQKHRDQKKGNVSVTIDETLHATFQEQPNDVTETSPESESESESEQRGKSAPLARPSQRGSRLPDDWELPAEWRVEAERIVREAGRPVAVSREAEKFRDHWHSAPGKGGVKLDWLGTWRNWIRRATEYAPKSNGRHHGDDLPIDPELNELLQREARKHMGAVQ